MALGRQRDHQAEMLVSWVEMPRSPGHAFYDKLQGVLIAAGFDRFIETQCAVDYAPRLGRPSLPPGRYFRMLLIGYFEGANAESFRLPLRQHLPQSPDCRLVEHQIFADPNQPLLA